MKKQQLALFAALGVALLAKADNALLNGTNFESYNAGTTISGDTEETLLSTTENTIRPWNYDDATVGPDVTVKEYSTEEGGVAAPSGVTVPDAFANDTSNGKYLSIDTYGTTLRRSVTGGTEGRTISEGVYIDTLVQFTATSADDTVSPESGDKLLVWLKTDDAAENPTYTLMVTAGAYSQGTMTPTAYEVNASVVPGAWYRLTVASDLKESAQYATFKVYIDGTLVKTSDGQEEFNSLVVNGNSDGAVYNTLTSVGFKGTGAIDDYVATSINPFAATSWKYTIVYGANIASYTYSYEANGETKKETVTVSEAGSATIDIPLNLAAITVTATAADGYYAVVETATPAEAGATATITAKKKNLAVTVGETTSDAETINDAMTLIGSGTGTIKFLDNYSEAIEISEGTVTLDVNGKTLSAAGATISISGGTVVITDTSDAKGGIITATTDDEDTKQAVVVSSGALTIQDAGIRFQAVVIVSPNEEEESSVSATILGGYFINKVGVDTDEDTGAETKQGNVTLAEGKTWSSEAGKYTSDDSDESEYYTLVDDGDERKAISSLTIEVPAQTYTGSALTPAVTVKDGETTLTADTDYTVSYEENIVNAGNYTVTITATENSQSYKGTTTATFTVEAAAVTPTITLSAIEATLRSDLTLPTVTVGAEGYTLTESDYDTAWNPTTIDTAATETRTYTVTVTMKGNFSGSNTATFTAIYASGESGESGTHTISDKESLSKGGTLTVKSGTTKIMLEDVDVSAGFDINGTAATLKAPVIEPTVEEGETKKEAIVINDDEGKVTLNVKVVKGLYYGVGVSTSLDVSRPEKLTKATEDNKNTLLTVNKPTESGSETKSSQGFFKVFVDIKE